MSLKKERPTVSNAVKRSDRMRTEKISNWQVTWDFLVYSVHISRDYILNGQQCGLFSKK